MRKYVILLFLILSAASSFGQMGRFFGTTVEPAVAGPSTLLDDIVSYYQLDEESGNAIDAHGDNDGTVGSATQGNGGIVGGAYGFASNFYVEIDEVITDVAAATTGTVNVWVRPNDATPPGTRVIWAFGDANANESIRLFQLTSGKLGIAHTDGGSNRWRIETTGAVLADNTWAMITVIQDGTPVLYIDGVAPAQSFTVSTDVDDWFSVCAGLDKGRIGDLNANNSGESLGWGGLIDEFGIWNRAITTSELSEIYASGSGNTYPFDGSGGSSPDVDGEQVEKPLGGGSGAPMGFLQYLPDDYSTTDPATYPTIIFLHGAGERGNGSTQLDLVDNHGIPLKIKNGWNATVGSDKFIVLSPQQTTSYWGFEGNPSDDIPNDALEFALWAINDSGLRIDLSRVYVTGYSMGDAWSPAGFVGDIEGVPYTNIFAAIAPVSTDANFADGQSVGNRDIPVWAFHGGADGTITPTDGFRGINGFNSVGGTPTPIWTEYSGLGHSSAVWDTRVYATDNTYHDPNLYEWFLTNTKP